MIWSATIQYLQRLPFCLASFGVATCCFFQARAAELPFARVVVGTVENPWVKIIGDIDGDGFLDVIIGTQAGNLTWFANPNWTPTFIGGGFNSVDGEVGDVDGDGDLDIIMGGTDWFENPRPTGDPSVTGAWKRHVIGDFRGHDVEVADLDGDGKLDVVVRDQGDRGNVIRIFKQITPDSWLARDLPAPTGEGMTLGDIDRDGDPDIIIGGQWYENTRDILNGPWTIHVITSEWHPNAVVKMGDINGDDRPDVVMSSSENLWKVSWFEAPPDAKSGSWTEHLIEAPVDSAHGIALFDMNHDGSLDVVTAEWHGQNRVMIYFNGGGGTSWIRQIISTNGLHNLRVGDFQNDGDLDIMGAMPFGNVPIELWENQLGPRPPFKALVFTKTAGFRHDSIPDGIAAIRNLGLQNNFTVDATEDAALFTDANLGQYQAVVFLSTTGDVLNDNQQAAFERYIRRGGGFVGLHSASDTEYTWPWYGGLVGAYFRSHPAVQRATIRVEDHVHPSTASLPDNWTRTDEWYNFRSNPRTDVNVLAALDEATYSGGDMGDHPIAWWHGYDGGRAWYTGGGHTQESYTEPLFLAHILGGIQYAAGITGEPVLVNQAPAAAIRAPANNAIFAAPANLTIVAEASDHDGSIARVEFYQGTTKLGEVNTTPYQFSWNDVAAGGYLLTAKATDDRGAITTSAPVFVTVGNGQGQGRSIDLWKGSKFSPAQLAELNVSGDLADPDGDGIINLLEYAFNLEPLIPDRTRPHMLRIQKINGEDYLTLSYTKVKLATDLDYVVEVSEDLLSWNSGESYTEQISLADQGAFWTATVRDRTPVTTAGKHFFRVRIIPR